MLNKEKALGIVYACDDNFVPLLAASIKSLEINNPEFRKNIYVIDDGISVLNKHKLEQTVNASVTRLEFFEVEDVIGKVNLPYFNNGALPITTFFRLFVHVFLPKDMDRVLYLDSDTLIVGRLDQLWELDLGDNIIAAVQDQGIRTLGCEWGGGVRNWKELGFRSEDKYFNAGVLLIDLKKWADFKVCEKALDVASKYRKYIVYADQYCLNAVLATRWLELGKEWNHLVSDNSPGAHIIHYIGNKPIYTNYSYSEDYRQLFFSYLSKTVWKDLRLVGGYVRNVRMFKRFVRKLIG